MLQFSKSFVICAGFLEILPGYSAAAAAYTPSVIL
jgi:hypothetical protein